MAEPPLASRCKLRETVSRGPGHRLTQRRSGVDECASRNVEAHQFHHHLVGIGRPVKGAGAGTVIACGLGLEQFLAARLALGE